MDDWPWWICSPLLSNDVVHLPTHNGDVDMVMDRGRGTEVFLESFSKSSFRLPYVLLITFQFDTLIPVDYSSFICYVVPILGVTRRFLMVLHPLKWPGHPPHNKHSETFTLHLGVWYHLVDVFFAVVIAAVRVLCVCW